MISLTNPSGPLLQRGKFRASRRHLLHATIFLHLLALPAYPAARCLTPAAGDALRAVVESGALRGVLGSDFQLERLNVTGDTIELVIEDKAQQQHGLTLALPEADRGAPDGQGRQLVYFLTTPSAQRRPDVSEVLLAAATLFDQALPASAIVNCGGEVAPSPTPAPAVVAGESSRAVALTSAALQIAVVVAAILIGLSVVRSRP